MALLSALAMEIAIPVCAVIGMVVSLWQWHLGLRNSDNHNNPQPPSDAQVSAEGTYLTTKNDVSQVVESFLSKEYWYAGVFVVAFAFVIFLLLGSVESFSTQSFSTQSRPCKFDPSKMCKPALVTAFFSAVSFLLGAFTSVLFGSLGTKIAICANARIALNDENIAGRTFRSGPVMGLTFAAFDLVVLYLAIILFKLCYGNDWEGLFEAITGYVLGGSSMAFFGRTSGGIYAKAADVCVHLVNGPEQYRQQAVTADYVGDIVGDIAGMGPDLFVSHAKSSCAALVLASISSFGMEHNFTAMCYPLLIGSMGILVCLISTFWWEIRLEIRPASLKGQLIISTTMTIGIAIVSWIALPSSFTIYNIGLPKVVKNWELFLCAFVGLLAGQISGFVNIDYTNDNPSCLQHVYDAANNICSCLPNEVACNCCTFFLYFASNDFCHDLRDVLKDVGVTPVSVSVPFLTAFSIFLSYRFAAMYGIAVAALGMLSTTATRLAIDASVSISNNAQRTRMGHVGAPEAAGYPTAAIGKGFPLVSAALVSIALLGAFVNRPAMSSSVDVLTPKVMSSSVDVLTPKVIIGLIMGAWLPYCFSAMTMKCAGRAGFKMALKVCEPIEVPPEPINATCSEISIGASFMGAIISTALVMFTPLIIGTVCGVETLSGLLAGSLSSVVQIATSASKTDGAWNQAKVYVEAGALKYAKNLHEQSNLRSKAERGEAVGDPKKDTSGPPLNILIQLMAVEALVFAPFFAIHGGLLFKFL